MLKVVYNEYKGYCSLKKPLGLPEEPAELLTDGFDGFDWDGEEYDHELGTDDRDMYNDESTHALAHKNDGELSRTSISPEPKGRTKKKLTRHQQKLADRKENKNKKNKRKGNASDVASDARKVSILAKMYKDTMAQSGKKNLDDKLFQFFDVSIYAEDLYNLKDDEWLSDNNISFMYELLERYQLFKYDTLVKDSILLVRPSMCYLLAQTPQPQQLKGVIPPLESAKFLFLPVNDSDDVEAVGAGSHWSLVVISLLDRLALIYDSMDSANDVESRQVVDQVEKYLGNGTRLEIMSMATPQQLNGSDCGVIVSQITGVLTSRLLQLEHLKTHCVDFGLEGVGISAIDGRIFMMGTMRNVMRHKLELA